MVDPAGYRARLPPLGPEKQLINYRERVDYFSRAEVGQFSQASKGYVVLAHREGGSLPSSTERTLGKKQQRKRPRNQGGRHDVSGQGFGGHRQYLRREDARNARLRSQQLADPLGGVRRFISHLRSFWRFKIDFTMGVGKDYMLAEIPQPAA